MNGRDWLNSRLRDLKRDPQLSTTVVERIERPKLDPTAFRIDRRGKTRYMERPDGSRMRVTARGDGSTVVLEPGTPEFHARYTQPPEPIIEQFRPKGAEGYEFVKLDQEGNPLED